MSERFPPESVEVLAEKFGWREHIGELTRVLDQGEAAHDEALRVRDRYYESKTFQKQRQIFRKRVQDTQDAWQILPESERDNISWHVWCSMLLAGRSTLVSPALPNTGAGGPYIGLEAAGFRTAVSVEMAPRAWQHWFGILSIALHLIHDATKSPPGGPGPVFPGGDLPGLVDDDTRDLGRPFPRPGDRRLVFVSRIGRYGEGGKTWQHISQLGRVPPDRRLTRGCCCRDLPRG